MCGVTGFLFEPGGRRERGESFEATLSRMTATLERRGPDDSGVWCDASSGVALGHRRLSILDLTPTGRQPMESVSGRYVVAFNGEIYNFKTLRDDLRKSGVTFRGASDTEVLLACVERHGLDGALLRLNGMFAIALWDKRERALHLVRDRFGEKPLYYGAFGGDFLFGSELKALRAHPSFRAGIDRTALAAYFRYNFVPQPRSIYEGVFKVPPGTGVVVRFDSRSREWHAAAPSPFWSLRKAATEAMERPFGGTEEDALEELTDLLGDAVRMRMESDVPLGAFLSGGIDSSAVVALMRQTAGGRVKTFSIGFVEASHDESAEAAAVAKSIGTEHHVLTVTAKDALGVVPKLPLLYDEPFADPSQIPTWLVSEFARSGVTVSLSGDGGDELFGGYSRHIRAGPLWHKLASCPGFIRRGLAAALRAVSPGAWDRIAGAVARGDFRERHFGDKLHKFARALSAKSDFQFYLSFISPGAGSGILADEPGEDPLAAFLETLWSAGGGFAGNAMLCDAAGYLEGDILVKVDRASMGVGLEARLPFLDPRVFEFAWRLPARFKIRDGIGKVPLRKLLARHVPGVHFDRPKTGFHMPVGAWLRGPLKDWADSLLDATLIRGQGYLRDEAVSGLWSEHLTGARNHEDTLWGILMFQAWLKENTA